MPKKHFVWTKETLQGERYDIGDYTYGKLQVEGSLGRIVIGRFCSLAEGVTALMVGHNTGWASTYPFNAFPDAFPAASRVHGHPYAKGDLVVGSDVWLGHESVLLGGVAVGHGAVVAARAVVTKDVPPYAVVAGNPARVVKTRFGEDVVQRLLALAWWDWPDEKIQANAALLCSPHVEKLLAAG